MCQAEHPSIHPSIHLMSCGNLVSRETMTPIQFTCVRLSKTRSEENPHKKSGLHRADPDTRTRARARTRPPSLMGSLGHSPSSPWKFHILNISNSVKYGPQHGNGTVVEVSLLISGEHCQHCSEPPSVLILCFIIHP